MKKSALEKRIRRNVSAREHRFFVVVPKGFVSVCRLELVSLLGNDRHVTEIDGGLEFTGDLTDLYRANLHLRTASRILMRFCSFHASDFRTLEKKLREIPWELYLDFSHIPEIHVTARKSRLYHSSAIAERFIENIAFRLGTSDLNKKNNDNVSVEQKIFVRIVKDRFELSLDSSGDLLYIRGIKTHGGKAPLRENIAAGLLVLSGYDCNMPLLDPMCGTGTFSLEAAMMVKNIPPGWFRQFAFENWPCFSEKSYSYIRKIAEENMLLRSAAHPDGHRMIYASDKDDKSCSDLAETVKKAGLESTIKIKVSDVFDIVPPSFSKGLVIVNPPYGLRLGTRKISYGFIDNLLKHWEKNFTDWKFGLVSPFDRSSLKTSLKISSHQFFHGGLNLFLFNGRV